MEIAHLVGYILAIFVGMTLGILGSGGSILSVPILVYVMGIEPVLATGYSLFVIGTTSLIGGLQKTKNKLVDFSMVISFGIPAIIAVFIARKVLISRIPDVVFVSNHITLTKSLLIMVVFALVMIFTSLRMINPSKQNKISTTSELNYYKITFLGVLIGTVSGFVGAGGGFLIVPTLLLHAQIPMKKAIGTSLFIVAAQSLIGFTGDLTNHQVIDWKIIILFNSASILGIFIGNFISKKTDDAKLKMGFGWFVFAMGLYIVIKEFFY